MSRCEMEMKIRELKRLEEMENEIASKADALRNEIKNEMNLRGVETLTVGSFIIKFTSCLTSRFDTKKFKENFGEIYHIFVRQVASKKFSIV